MRRISGLVGLMMIATIAVAGPIPAYADVETPDALSPAVNRDLIVLPAELAAYGISPEEIQAQQDLIASLSPAQTLFQEQLRKEQDKLTAEGMVGDYYDSSGRWVAGDPTSVSTLKEVNPPPIALGPKSNDRRTINAVTPNDPCATGDYHVKYWNGFRYVYRCYAGLGQLMMSGGLSRIKAHYGGTYASRMFYHHNGNYFWSVWRAGYTEHSFDDLSYYGSVTLYGVQRSL